MASGGDAARARRAAQRRNAANVRSGRYQRQFSSETRRARAAATRLKAPSSPAPSQAPRSLGDIRGAIKAKKRRVIGDAFKFSSRSSDSAVDKHPAEPAMYSRVLRMTDNELQEFYDNNTAWDDYKFLYYH